ncbi:MAG: hypothetical protein QM758_03885 [Armatimonas sp.]
MRDEFAYILELICQSTVMDKEAAADFLEGHIAAGEIGKGWLILALMWLRPEAARKRYLDYTEAVGHFSYKMEALWEAHELRKKDEAAQAAYHVIGALLPKQSPEAAKYRATCRYLSALESLKSLLGELIWYELPDVPLLFRLCKEFPAELESAILQGKAKLWRQVFCIARLLLVAQERTSQSSAEVAHVIRLYRQWKNEFHHPAEVYAIVKGVDLLEQSEPDLLVELLPDLLPFCHSNISDSRIQLRFRVLTLIAPGAVDRGELRRLLSSGLEEEGRRRQIQRWDNRIGSVVSKLRPAEERDQRFARRALVRLQRILVGGSL